MYVMLYIYIHFIFFIYLLFGVRYLVKKIRVSVIASSAA